MMSLEKMTVEELESVERIILESPTPFVMTRENKGLRWYERGAMYFFEKVGLFNFERFGENYRVRIEKPLAAIALKFVKDKEEELLRQEPKFHYFVQYNKGVD